MAILNGTLIGTDYTAEYQNDPETKEQVFAAVVEFFQKEECFSGECVYQSDSVIINAPELLAKLTDEILKFKVTWQET